MQYQIVNAKQLSAKAKTHSVERVQESTYKVTSGTSGNQYLVVLLKSGSGATCSCKWGQRREQDDWRSGCSHAQAVMAHIAAERGQRLSVWASIEDARRQHRPVKEIGDGVVVTVRTV